ncbi:hypothetical protein C211_11772 [Stutzerimonas degradans]|nr:hypothetical protein C211_11772 [Stutzerimonas degradans]
MSTITPRRNPVDGPWRLLRFPGQRLLAAFFQQRGGHQAQRQPDSQRQEQQVVQIAQYRDEVGNQVDGTERISHHAQGDQLGQPGRTRIPACEPEHHHLALEQPGPAAEIVEHHERSVSVTNRGG